MPGDTIVLKCPHGLTLGGKRFWKFLFDEQVAAGNGERAFYRSPLIIWYTHTLPNVSDHCPMEQDRGFIQWLFPLPAEGEDVIREHAQFLRLPPVEGAGSSMPVLSLQDYVIMKDIPEVQAKLAEHFMLFIHFIGVAYTNEGGFSGRAFAKDNTAGWNNWISNPYNNVRISRVLESMANFGFDAPCKALYVFLKKESERQPQEEGFLPFSDKARFSCQEFWAKSQRGTQFGAGIGR